MRLLIVTQKVDKNDDNLGFFHRWVEEFAGCTSEVFVIAGFVGEHSLPANVLVFSLGKEKGLKRPRRILRYWELFSKYYAKSDAVFFHMCPEFVLAALPFLISLKRPTALWYVHKSISRRLRRAERLVDWVFTASEPSFRLPSKKVIYTGHAIDTNIFVPNSKPETLNSKTVRMLTVGRISPVKDLETVIRASRVLKETWDREWILSITGGPLLPRDENYLTSLKKMVEENGLGARVQFYGPRPYTEIPELYREHDVFISASTTGSVDKSVLEAMSSGLTVITANEAFRELLPPRYFLEKRSPEFLAGRIKALADEPLPNLTLREVVTRSHSLENTIAKIYGILSTGF